MGAPDPGGPAGTALLGATAGMIVVALALRAFGGTSPFVRGMFEISSRVAVGSEEPSATTPAAFHPPRSKRTYNVILITVDTLRYDLGFMGYPRAVTPNIDALAARGVVFERTYSTASFTPKSLGPMHIGRYASATNRDFEHYTTFFPSNIFLAERAREAGVRTFAGMCHRYFTFKSGFQQGFDVFDVSAMPANMNDNDTRSTSKPLTDVALNLLSKPENVSSGRPFFAWFHYFDPHLPYVAHEGVPNLGPIEPTQSGKARGMYDEEVWYTDSHIGRLLEFIDGKPWAADTAVILTADHGEAFGEHKHWGHGRELWEPLVRVPLIVRIPGVPSRRIANRRSHVDVAPTIVELLGASEGPPGSLQGASLVPDILARPQDPLVDRDTFIDMPEGRFNEMRRALITGPSPGMKVTDIAGRRLELYDLASDPDENHNLSSDRERLRPFAEKIQKFAAKVEDGQKTVR